MKGSWSTGCWFQIVFYFHPETLGKMIHFDEYFFQMGWFNHLEELAFFTFWDFHDFVTLSIIFRKSAAMLKKRGWFNFIWFYLPSRLRNLVIH